MSVEAQSSDRSTRWLLPALVLLYLGVAFGQSAIKLLWADELITFYIAQQPGWGGIWRALGAGTDPNPPLIHVLVQASTSVFGIGATAVRVPAILCGLVAILSIWAILRRWVAPRFAASGVLAFMCTRGFDYSYDARSYAPLMAFGMLAFALWVGLPEERGELRLVGLAVALALGISSNYYGVLAFFPVAAGEAVRIVERRKVSWGVWLAMFAGAAPLVAYLPLIRHNIAQFAPHAWNRPQASMIAVSYLELVEGVFWPVVALAAWCVWKRLALWRLPRAEITALGILLLYPIIGFGVAVAGAGMISPRCVIPVCCGFGVALGVLASRVWVSNRRATSALMGFFLVWMLVREGFCATQLHEQRMNFLALRDVVARQPQGKILVADSALVLPLYYYSDEPVRQRIIFPLDFEAIHRYETDDSGEQNLWAGRDGVFPFSVIPFTDVDVRQPGLVVIAREQGWLAQSIRQKDVSLVPSSQAKSTSEWYGVGGIFTPMAHTETRILLGGTGHQ